MRSLTLGGRDRHDVGVRRDVGRHDLFRTGDRVGIAIAVNGKLPADDQIYMLEDSGARLFLAGEGLAPCAAAIRDM